MHTYQVGEVTSVAGQHLNCDFGADVDENGGEPWLQAIERSPDGCEVGQTIEILLLVQLDRSPSGQAVKVHTAQ